jgi:hypothetical protein
MPGGALPQNGSLILSRARLLNLKEIDARFPLGVMTCDHRRQRLRQKQSRRRKRSTRRWRAI